MSLEYCTRNMGAEDDPRPLINIMACEGWALVATYNFERAWGAGKVKLIFSRPKNGATK
jgi:hypothetical protein